MVTVISSWFSEFQV